MTEVLVDTVIWIDHFRRADSHLQLLLHHEAVLGHEMVVGELAIGSIPHRDRTLTEAAELPQAIRAEHQDVMALIERHRLYGTGISLIDAHLLASTLITPGARLWTRDRRLREAAESLEVAHLPA